MNDFIHDVIKIRYSDLGYLPNHPYHLISDKEMFNAFMNDPTDLDSLCYFNFMYPYPLSSDIMMTQYLDLRQNIYSEIQNWLNLSKNYDLPTWIYSYMLGAAISNNSSISDKHDMLVLMNMDNKDDEITDSVTEQIYSISKNWLSKIKSRLDSERTPTLFGEPHVIKSLRLTALDLNSGGN